MSHSFAEQVRIEYIHISFDVFRTGTLLCANHLNLPQREVPMRKIRHAKSRQVPSPEKKEPRFASKNIWAIGIIPIMVFSAVGFYYADRQDSAPGYHGVRFKLR